MSRTALKLLMPALLAMYVAQVLVGNALHDLLFHSHPVVSSVEDVVAEEAIEACHHGHHCDRSAAPEAIAPPAEPNTTGANPSSQLVSHHLHDNADECAVCYILSQSQYWGQASWLPIDSLASHAGVRYLEVLDRELAFSEIQARGPPAA